MIRFYGPQPPHILSGLQVGGFCPHCKTGTRFMLTTQPIANLLRKNDIKEFVANYSCELCLGPIPVMWDIRRWADANSPSVEYPRVVTPMREEYNYDHVPNTVKKEIEEALDCLSVNAYNGFAAVCRRAVQKICTNLGAQATSKVKKQITEMAQLSGLNEEIKDIAIQIMLCGHDGSHPHLPEMNPERAEILLSLLRDLTYELYTRPGKVKAAAKARISAKQKNKEKTKEKQEND